MANEAAVPTGEGWWSRAGTSGFVAGVLVAAVLFNVAERPAVERRIEERRQDRWQFTYVRETADFAVVGLGPLDSRAIRERRAVYLELSLVAPEAVVHLPEESTLDLELLLSHGDVRAVRVYDSTASPEVRADDVADHIVAQDAGSPERGPGPFAIALLDGDADEIVVGENGDHILLVDARLLGGAVPASRP